MIKTPEDHEAMLAEVAALAAHDPQPGTPKGDRLELLAKLVEEYEKEKFPIDPPDPISAIRFRLDQLGLDVSDLVPYLGSRSRVSEVMSGKRGLSLAMIRSLREGLEIPAEALIGKVERAHSDSDPDWTRLPIREMVRRKWIASAHVAREFVTESARLAGLPVFRMGISQRVRQSADQYSVVAWTARVVQAASQMVTRDFGGQLTGTFLREVVALSTDVRGPIAAQALLAVHGIPLVIEPPLPRTGIDGCSFRLEDGRPAIALSLRHDRLDHFWFTLLHELAHVVLHITQSSKVGFIDDLEEHASSEQETEADSLAEESMIPRSSWNHRIKGTRSVQTVLRFAEEHQLHPAIVAGRIRYDTGNFKLFSKLVGQGKVRKWFYE